MLTVLISLLALVAGLAITQLALWWSRCLTTDWRSAQRAIDEFYESAQRLLKDEATPQSVVEFVSFLSSRVGRPELARSFAYHLIRGRVARNESAGGRRFVQEIAEMPQASRETFAALVLHGMVSSAAADMFLSRVYLFWVLQFLSANGRRDGKPSVDRASTVAMDVEGLRPAHGNLQVA
jgi:hypothetical protein